MSAPDKQAPQNWDYSEFLRGQVDDAKIAAAKKNDPFCGETPTIGKDYRAYQKYWEGEFHEALGNAIRLKWNSCCETVSNGQRIVLPGRKKNHIGSNVILACDHLLPQDPENPDGVYFFPLERGGTAGYYVCPPCFRAIERHKYNFGREIKMKCALCIGEFVSAVSTAFPDRLITLRDK